MYINISGVSAQFDLLKRNTRQSFMGYFAFQFHPHWNATESAGPERATVTSSTIEFLLKILLQIAPKTRDAGLTFQGVKNGNEV